MSKSNADTISMMVDNIQIADRANPNTNLSLQVLSSVADVSAQNTVYLQDNEQTQVNRLIEEAVATAGNSEESSMMLANVMSKSNADTISMMVDNIQIFDDQSALQGGNNNENSSLSLQILSSVSDINFESGSTFQSSEQTQVNRLIQNAIASAGNNAEDSMMLANVITKSDSTTVGIMFDSIATVSSKDVNSTLAVQVLSSVAITAADSTTSVNTELKDKVNFFIDTVTKTSEAAATEAAEEAAATKAAEEAAATEAAEEAEEAAATEAAEEAAATEAAEEAAATKAAEATEAAEEAAAEEAAATEAAEEAVTYNAQGFSNSSPFKHKNGTSFNSDGRDYQGYNEAGYNSEGYSSSTPPIYNPDYDVSPA